MKVILPSSLIVLLFIACEARVWNYKTSTGNVNKTTSQQSREFSDDQTQHPRMLYRESNEHVSASLRSSKTKKQNQEQHSGTKHLSHKDMMRLAMQKMFGFDQGSQGVSSTQSPTDVTTSEADASQNTDQTIVQENTLTRANLSSTLSPPDFMLDLHRVYTQDKSFMLSQSKIQGDTIRSFFPSSAGEK